VAYNKLKEKREELRGVACMKKTLIACIVTLPLVGCGRTDAARPVRLGDANAPVAAAVNAAPLPETRLPEINLAAIGRIAPKGRVQDREYNQLLVIEQLLAHGRESIPYLISQLDDETKIEGHVKGYWSEVRIGDVALIILTNFFTDSSWTRTTIPGVAWDEFLGGGNNAGLTGEDRLRNYIDLRGRKSIKERWQRVWERHGENIRWNDEERCFISKSTN
jgi:hypothetical protein